MMKLTSAQAFERLNAIKGKEMAENEFQQAVTHAGISMGTFRKYASYTFDWRLTSRPCSLQEVLTELNSLREADGYYGPEDDGRYILGDDGVIYFQRHEAYYCYNGLKEG